MAREIVKIERIPKPPGYDTVRDGLLWARFSNKEGRGYRTPLVGYINDLMGQRSVLYAYGNWSSVVGWGIEPRNLPSQQQDW